MKAIPSSIPGENVEKAPPSARPLRANSKAKEKAIKSTILPRGGAQKRPRLTARDGHSREPPSQSEDELAMRDAGVEEEGDGTEPADEAEVEHSVAGPSTRKRKRGAPATTRTTRAKSKATKKVVKQPSVTPVIRQGKGLRTPSINRGAYVPTRVFALWKDDGHYYPGVVQSHEGGSIYLVKFDDNSTAKVKIDQMRLCELHVGDDILLPPNSHGCKVVDIAKFDSENIVGVSVEDAVEELSVSDILIANKTIIYAWKDRMLTSDSIVPVQAKPSPTPSKLSLASGGPSVRNNHRKILAKTGVVITLSSNNNSQWEKDRENIMAAVKNTGVTVIEDWASVFRMEGKHSHSNNKWVIEKSEVKWVENKDIERVFLLADNANQKPKFLLALGLGIPCVCVSWLHDSVNAVSDIFASA